MVNIDEIKRKHNARNPFRDYEFDAVDTNMFYSRALPPHVKIEWKRPWVSENYFQYA